MKRFPSEIWYFKHVVILCQIHNFAKKLKNHVLSFLLMSGLCVINGT